tara:strand:+ start:65 stop:289 length:225 start_codon:yes stop_codon:yes gene_type:complete
MFCCKNQVKNKDKNELKQQQPQPQPKIQNQKTTNHKKKDTISLAERRGKKIGTFKLPNTKEKEDTTIEYIKPPF